MTILCRGVCIFIDGPYPKFFNSVELCRQFVEPLYQVAEWYNGQILEYSVYPPKARNK